MSKLAGFPTTSWEDQPIRQPQSHVTRLCRWDDIEMAEICEKIKRLFTISE